MGEKLCQALGRGNVREMPRGNFKRLDAQTLARHSALPIGSDRAVPGCHDVARWNFVIENNPLVVNCQGHETIGGFSAPNLSSPDRNRDRES